MRNPDHGRRVVVTGMGVISPVGNDTRTAWRNLMNGVSGIGPLTRFDASASDHPYAGEVRNFEPTQWLSAKDVRRSDRAVHYGVAAAKQALADSGLDITDRNHHEVGVVFGSGGFSQQLVLTNLAAWQERGIRAVNPFFVANGLVDSAAAMIAIETGALGHNACMVTSCATGTHNIAEGAAAIRRGDCVAVIAGSTEAPLLELIHVGFVSMHALGSPRPGQPPADVARPFDRSRDGFVMGEGAGGLLLEDLAIAKERGARIYAEVVGSGSSSDGYAMAAPAEHGEGSARAMAMALERGRVRVDDVDLINAHGSSTRLGDRRESEAIWTVFGDRTPAIAISATKSQTGHMMGATGAFEACATVMSIYEGCVPATLNYREPDPACNLSVVTEATERPIRFALSNNLGLGGHNGAILFKRYEGD